METPQDITIYCKTCQKPFVWSAKEQMYYKKKGFAKKPQKCDKCRDMANKLRSSNMFYIHCGICDKEGTMLNPPPKDRVGLCENCYLKLVQDSKNQSK